jgi:hypothetical protein
MKTLFLLLAVICLFSFESSFSLSKDKPDYEIGNLYYDAMFLAKNKDTKDHDNMIICNSIKVTYKLDYSNNVWSIDTNDSSMLVNNNPSMVTINGNFQSNLITGTARFLAERAKEEINVAFFERMKDRINEYPELQAIFPSTNSILSSIKTYQYGSILQVLKDAFESDVNTIQVHLYDLTTLNSTSYSGSVKDRITTLESFFKTPNGLAVKLALFALKEEPNSPNFSVLLDAIANSKECTDLATHVRSNNNTKNLASLMKLTNEFSKSFLSKGTENVWITKAQFDSLLGNQDALDIFLSVFNEKVKHIKFYSDSGVPTTETSINFDSSKLKPLISSFSSMMQSANQSAKQIKSSFENAQPPSSIALMNHFKTISNLAKVILKENKTHKFITAADSNLHLVESTIEPAFDILYHLYTKKYTSIVYDVNNLLKSLNDPKTDNFLSSFIKYGTVITSIASANSSDEVKQAIEASVLPVGSSSIKRNSSNSLTLNSYVGIGRTTNLSKSNISSTSDIKLREKSLYLFAPVGLTWTLSIEKCRWANIGLHLNLFDLGAIVQHYLVNGDTSTLSQEVTFKDVFSPGVSVLYHIPCLPISLATSWNYIPSLNVPDLKKNENGDLGQYFRWNFSVLIDIPLLNFWVRE